MFTERGLD